MHILSISDTIIPFIYSDEIREKIRGGDPVISCGDLMYYYQEFILKKLHVPLYFVRGNHDQVVEYDSDGERKAPGGGIDLHPRFVHKKDLILAGVEGCIRYNPWGGI